MSDMSRRTRELVELFVRTKEIDPAAYEKAKKMSEEKQKAWREKIREKPE